ncbi:MAG TPA: hypothetical protein VJ810_21640 [Blastocatellia bacterium]|nr:hypothetical protein [Blastocatellia bacterium]
MRSLIVDTDVASFLFKEDTRGDMYKPHLADAVAWIAATALLYGLELVTHNATDFDNLPGLTIITEA